MKSYAAVLAPLLLSIASAQPHGHGHQHRDLHLKRDYVMHTVVEWVTETVDITTTVWVDPTSTPLPSLSSSTNSSSTFMSSSADPVTPVVFHESTAPPEYDPPTPSPPSSSSSSSSSIEELPVYVAPTPPPSSPTTSSTPEVQPPAYTPPVVQPPVYTPPPPSSTSSQAAPTSSSGPGGPVSGDCTSASPCEGDMTYYDIDASEYSSCGWHVDGMNEPIVALSAALMGEQSNGNPYCGRYITVELNGKTVSAKAADKCPGCALHDIDLSHKAFDAICAESVGRTRVKWWFTS